jgi:hypothetical protein
MEHVMDPLVAMMKDLGDLKTTAELKQTVIVGIMREAGKVLWSNC